MYTDRCTCFSQRKSSATNTSKKCGPRHDRGALLGGVAQFWGSFISLRERARKVIFQFRPTLQQRGLALRFADKLVFVLGSSLEGSRAASPEMDGKLRNRNAYGQGDGPMSYKDGQFMSHFEDEEREEVLRPPLTHCAAAALRERLEGSDPGRHQYGDPSCSRGRVVQQRRTKVSLIKASGSFRAAKNRFPHRLPRPHHCVWKACWGPGLCSCIVPWVFS